MAAPQACRSIIWNMLADVVTRWCAKQYEEKSSLFFGEAIFPDHKHTTSSPSASTTTDDDANLAQRPQRCAARVRSPTRVVLGAHQPTHLHIARPRRIDAPLRTVTPGRPGSMPADRVTYPDTRRSRRTAARRRSARRGQARAASHAWREASRAEGTTQADDAPRMWSQPARGQHDRRKKDRFGGG